MATIINFFMFVYEPGFIADFAVKSSDKTTNNANLRPHHAPMRIAQRRLIAGIIFA